MHLPASANMLHQCSARKAQNDPRGVAQPPPPAHGSASARTDKTHRARATRRAEAAHRPWLLPYHVPVLGRPSNTRGRSRGGSCPFSPPSARALVIAPLGAPGAHLERRGAGGLRKAPPALHPPPAAPAAPPPPAHRVPGVPEPEAHQCSARRPRQGGLAEAPAPRQARLPPRLTPGQLTQDAVRGGKARAEAPARAHGPACRHRPPLWRVAWGAAWARHGPRWAFAWGLVRRRGSFSTGGPSDTLLSSHFLVIFRGIPLFGQEGRLCSGGLCQ